MIKNIHKSLKFTKIQKKKIFDFLAKEIIISKIKLTYKILFSKWFLVIIVIGYICVVIPGFILLMIRSKSWKKFNKKNIKINKFLIFSYFGNISKNMLISKKIVNKKYKLDDFIYKKPKRISIMPKDLNYFSFYKNWLHNHKIHSSIKLNNLLIYELEIVIWNKYFEWYRTHKPNTIFLLYESKKINNKYKFLNLWLKILKTNSKNEYLSGEFFSGTLKNLFLRICKKKQYFLKNNFISIKSDNKILTDEILSKTRQEKINEFLKNNKGKWKKDFRLFISNQRIYVIHSTNFEPEDTTTSKLLWSKPANSKKKIIKNIYKNTIVYLDKILHAQEFINLFDDLFE